MFKKTTPTVFKNHFLHRRLENHRLFNKKNHFPPFWKNPPTFLHLWFFNFFICGFSISSFFVFNFFICGFNFFIWFFNFFICRYYPTEIHQVGGTLFLSLQYDFHQRILCCILALIFTKIVSYASQVCRIALIKSALGSFDPGASIVRPTIRCARSSTVQRTLN